MNERLSLRTDGTSNLFQRRSQRETLREFLRCQMRVETTRAQVIFDMSVGSIPPN
jgi:hypothetical protein